MTRAAILVLMLTGCAAPIQTLPIPDPGPPPSHQVGQHPLQGFKWRAVAVGGVPLVPGSEVFVRFAGDSVHGSAGCNGYGGRHQTRPGGSMAIADVTATRRGCFSEEIGDQENRFLRLLGSVARYAIESRGPDDIRLSLIAPGGTLLFRREPWAVAPPGPPPPPLPKTARGAILDREWHAVTIHGTPVAAGAPISLRLADGRAGGHSGCNSFGGPFEFDPGQYDQKIRFGPLAGTLMACTDTERQAQEQRFLDALRGTMIYSIDANGLLTLTAANMRTITFRPAR